MNLPPSYEVATRSADSVDTFMRGLVADKQGVNFRSIPELETIIFKKNKEKQKFESDIQKMKMKISEFVTKLQSLEYSKNELQIQLNDLHTEARSQEHLQCIVKLEN